MTEAIQNHEEMTCGEYLESQRSALAGIGDLSAPGAARKAEECLANIYAVSYQMNFERREPPSPQRGPAELERLDGALVAEMSDGLRYKAHALAGITEDPLRLRQAADCAFKGNGFALIEMVSTAFLERKAKAEQASDPQSALRTPVTQRQPEAETQNIGAVPGR